MIEPPIRISNELAVPRTVKDIVFVRRKNGEVKIAFSLRFFCNDGSCEFIESSMINGSNGNAGVGFYDIIGRAPLMPNDQRSINYLQMHVGQLFEVHVLLDGNEVISSEYINGSGQLVTDISKTNYSYITTRFANINAIRAEFGVVLKISDIPGSLPRNLVLEYSGSTGIKVNWKATSEAAFYSMFPLLNGAGVFGTDGSTSSSGNQGGS